MSVLYCTYVEYKLWNWSYSTASRGCYSHTCWGLQVYTWRLLTGVSRGTPGNSCGGSPGVGNFFDFLGSARVGKCFFDLHLETPDEGLQVYTWKLVWGVSRGKLFFFIFWGQQGSDTIFLRLHLETPVWGHQV